MTYTIKLRRSLASDWTTVNPVLSEGEFGYELDTRNFKIGDGLTAWNLLEYVIDENDRLPDASELEDNQILLTFGGAWTVVDLPSGLPDVTGVADGYMLATVDEAWVVQPIPSSPDELPTAVGEADGRLLGVVDEAWVAVDPPEGGGGGGGNVDGFVSGILAPGVGTNRIYNDSSAPKTLVSVRASVGIAPAGASIVVDVNVNDVSIFPTSTKPTIPPAGTTDKRVPDTTVWGVGEYLTVDVDAVGSTVAGSNLTVQIEVA